jgi:signal transduction histidine kinase/CheY-like chemotaxis protein/HAMP domain-containing protein
MKIINAKISTQLQLGLGAILLFVGLLGAVALIQSNSMWTETQGLYDHPLMVRRAVGEVKADILSMQLEMQNLVMAKNDQEMQTAIQNMDIYEANAVKQFDILYDRYLGPRIDIDEAHQAFIQWKAIRDETLQLMRSGQRVEAEARLKSDGVSGIQAEKIISQIEDVSNFAISRGDQFYNDAKTQKDTLMVRLWIVAGIILLLTVTISYFLLKGINDPLSDLTLAANQFRQGKLDTRSRYVSSNEFGVLATSFNALAESIQTEIQDKENAATIADVMLREDELRSFCRELLKGLLSHTNSQVGAFYLLNEHGSQFEHLESIGLNPTGRSSFSASEFEGEFGAALATQHIQHIRDIPADTRFTFTAMSGDLKPRAIITIPILAGSKVIAVLSLASVQNYSAQAVRLVNDIWSVLTARLNGVLAIRQVRAFSEKLEAQNRELTEQTKELAVQTDELGEQNIELEMQKNQLDETSRLKSAFLSNMSHELRTPLNSVIALSGVLARRLKGTIPDDEYSYIDVIERNGKLLLALINDILDLSRIEAGREEIRLSRFSIKELVGEVVEMIEPQAQEKDIALLNHIRADFPLITSDLPKCRHVLQNIIGNAVKFTSQGKVEISAIQHNGDIQISVTDTGIGITADQLPYIFDEFRQADESTSRKYGGTGLGLSIARKYAALLHGSIKVESVPGQGSTFIIRLPLSLMSFQDGGQGSATRVEFSSLDPASDQALGAVGPGKCILVVEDSEPAIIQLSDMLTNQGYTLQLARNGHEALEQIQSSIPDGMILDLMMPEVDGFEVLGMIRSQEKTSHLPVLILTAKHVSAEELAFLKGNHINQLIQKGAINKKQMLAAVARMVSPKQEVLAPGVRISPRPASSQKPTILVVEDNPDNRKTVKALLQDTCSIIEAEDGQSGVEYVKKYKPDLVLMDISLPILDGFKALAAIRQDKAVRDIPVVALTARAMKGDREQILSDGFDAYISKPVDAEILRNTIDGFLHGK